MSLTANKKPITNIGGSLKVGAGIGLGGAGLYGAGELAKNTDRLSNGFGHVGSVLGIGENTVASSSVAMPSINGGNYPILQNASQVLSKVKRVING